jgi:hypothetical protein
MNTLTPNRILQKGDEYRDNGKWKPVPENDCGLQVMFTSYAEVRRPTETPFVHGGAPAIKVSPDSVATAKAAPNAAKAESEKSPVPTHSGTGDPHSASYLPTVVSKKAHKTGLPTVDECAKAIMDAAIAHAGKPSRETPETSKDATTEVAKSPASPTPSYSANGSIKITFPKPDPTDLIAMSGQPLWTGRNGTFTGYGLEAMTVNTNVMFSPIGKRGVGNCAIQFPKAIIPQLVDWLQRQT